MMSISEMKQFENKQIRSAWNEEKEEWYFSVVDVVGALTDSANPTDYLKKMRKRDAELGLYLGTNCPQVTMSTESGKKRKTLGGTTKDVLRIIQSIPSKKAEPFKQWLAQVGAERLDETIDPELAIDRAFQTYIAKGYSEEWIHQRLLSIRIRNDLTAEWQARGVRAGQEFAILTNEISRAWSGMSTRQYKNLKGLKKENLRDNMTDTELVLNMLAETSTTTISKAEKPKTFEQSKNVARRGGGVAAVARKSLEEESGQPVITAMNAKDFAELLTGAVMESARLGEAGWSTDEPEGKADE